MTGTRRGLPKKFCGACGKILHASYSAAERALEVRGRRVQRETYRLGKILPYRCPVEKSGWHVGHAG